MKIGIDYDGTQADTNKQKSDWLKQKKNLDIPPYLTDRTSCIKELSKYMPEQKAKEVYNHFQTFIYTGDFAKAAPEIPGAIQGIRELARDHELWIITARPESQIYDTFLWLDDKNRDALKYFQGYHSSRSPDAKYGKILSKQEICQNYGFDAIIDDDERHLGKIKLPNFRRILLKNGAENCNSLEGLLVARNWEEVVKHLQ